MSVWLDKPRRRPDGELCDRLSKISLKFFFVLSRVQTVLPCPDVWILNAILALWISASERESTSSGRLQRYFHICVLERNHVASRTLSVVQTCCWNVRTNASWNSSKLLDTEEGLDGWCFGQLGVQTVYHVVRTDVSWLMSVRTDARDLTTLSWNPHRIF
jgi:hypothetical protein